MPTVYSWLVSVDETLKAPLENEVTSVIICARTASEAKQVAALCFPETGNQ